MTSPALILFAGPVEPITLSTKLSALFLADAKASERFWEFLAANIRNKNTRRAFYKAACRFSDWCEGRGIFDLDLATVNPINVAAFIEELQTTHSKPTGKQHLAALRMLFDWLVVGHTLKVNPAHAVRGPTHIVKKDKTPVLAADEARILPGSWQVGSLPRFRAAHSGPRPPCKALLSREGLPASKTRLRLVLMNHSLAALSQREFGRQTRIADCDSLSSHSDPVLRPVSKLLGGIILCV